MNEAVQPAILARGLSKSFPGIRAVEALSFEVHSGEIFGLVGPDGAGKTTALRMLAGILPPDAGTGFIAGVDVVREPERAKHELSYMPQRFGLYEELSVDENIRFYADLFGVRKAQREARSAELLRAAGMSEFRSRYAGKLSGGMKQKLGLICALIHRPRVLLLDEPTTGVDPVSRRDFWRILYELLAEGVAILTSTAYLDEAERCHRVALLNRGSLLFCDTPETLKSSFGKQVLIIVASEPRRAKAVLEGLNGISSLVLRGDAIRAVVDNAAQRASEFEVSLRKSGVAFDSIQRVSPTIEDLFVDAIGASEEPHA